jgi:hypothetical protein
MVQHDAHEILLPSRMETPTGAAVALYLAQPKQASPRPRLAAATGQPSHLPEEPRDNNI